MLCNEQSTFRLMVFTGNGDQIKGHSFTELHDPKGQRSSNEFKFDALFGQ